MQQRKLPNQLSDSELLDLLDSTEEVSESTELVAARHSDVILFMSQFNITAGEFPFKRMLMYKIYKKWAKDPIEKSSFTREISNFIKSDRTHYYIDQSKFHLTETAKQLLIPVNRLNSHTAQKHFQDFLKAHKIEEGKFFLSGRELFYFYDNWQYDNNKTKRLSFKQFRNFFKVTFEVKELTNELYFGINETAKEILTTEKLEAAYEWAKKNKKVKKT